MPRTGPTPGHPDPETLDGLRERCESLIAEVREERYQQQAGLKQEAELTRIHERYRDVINPASIARVQAAREAAPEASESRKRLTYLLEHLVDQHVGQQVRGIDDTIMTQEASASLQLSPEEAVGFRQASQEQANTEDRPRRGEIERLALEVCEKLTPHLAERLGIENGVARSLGFSGGRLEQWQALSGIDLRSLDELMQGFLTRTEDMYREAMSWMARRRVGLPLEDLRRHDLHWIFRGESWDGFFPKHAMVSTAQKMLAELGIDIRKSGAIHFDLEPRPGKRERAFCAQVKVPGRIILCLEPEGGRRDWQQFLHELGHALHGAYTDKNAPFEYRMLGDSSLAETFAFLLQYLLVDKRWLKRYVQMPRSRDYIVLASLEKLGYLRRYAARLRYEIELHAADDLDGMDEVYGQHMEKALLFPYPRELYLYDIDRTFYGARYLRAWLFEALLRRHLVHYFDEDWYRNPRSGAFLRDHWRMGRRLTVDEMVTEIGYDALSTRPIEERLEKDL